MDQTVISELGRSGQNANHGVMWSVQNGMTKWFSHLLLFLCYSLSADSVIEIKESLHLFLGNKTFFTFYV